MKLVVLQECKWYRGNNAVKVPRLVARSLLDFHFCAAKHLCRFHIAVGWCFPIIRGVQANAIARIFTAGNYTISLYLCCEMKSV